MSAQSMSLGVRPNGISLFPSPPVTRSGLRLRILTDSPGVIKIPGLRNTTVSIHLGRPINAFCRRMGYSHRGTVVHGDIEIIPAGVPSSWEITEKDTYLALSISPELLKTVAEEMDLDPGEVEIRNRFQVRDSQLENIGSALRAEMESGYQCGSLYFDSLAVAVAARLLRCHSSVSREPRKANGRMSERGLREVFSYIERNLNRNITLGDIAAAAGVSVSHFKTLFHASVGLPPHQYLIRRRVERAKDLLVEGKLPISQIAFETGFAHQSHMARHMRRLLGVSPKTLRQTLR